jgi:hypothetical protein
MGRGEPTGFKRELAATGQVITDAAAARPSPFHKWPRFTTRRLTLSLRASGYDWPRHLAGDVPRIAGPGELFECFGHGRWRAWRTWALWAKKGAVRVVDREPWEGLLPGVTFGPSQRKPPRRRCSRIPVCFNFFVRQRETATHIR